MFPLPPIFQSDLAHDPILQRPGIFVFTATIRSRSSIETISRSSHVGKLQRPFVRKVLFPFPAGLAQTRAIAGSVGSLLWLYDEHLH